MRALLKSVLNQFGHVDRAKQTRAIGWQWLLTTWVGGCDAFTIVEVIHRIDAIDKDNTGFCVIIRGLHDLVPQLAGVNRFMRHAIEFEIPS